MGKKYWKSDVNRLFVFVNWMFIILLTLIEK